MKISRTSLWLVITILCLIGAVALLGLSAKDAGKNTLIFWAMGREGDAVGLLIPAFEREHPGIRVDVQTLPWSGAHQKLLTAFAGGSTPDLCQMGNTWIPEFAEVGALSPLTARVETSKVINPNEYFPGIRDTNRIGKTLYGVPWYVDTRLLFYRRDLLARAGFTRPPKTWAQWAQQLAAIKKMVGPGRYSVLLPLNEFEPLVAFGLQQSEPLLRNGDRYGNFESPGFKKALRFYADMFHNRWAPKVTDAEISNEVSEFAGGYFTFFISGPWMLEELEAHMPKALQNAWTTAPLPGPDGPGASIAGGASLVIFRTSRHKRAAWQLIEYLSRPDVQRRFYRMTGDLPPRRRAAGAESARPGSAAAFGGGGVFTAPHVAAFREQLELARPTPKVPEWEQIASQIGVVGERLAHGELSVDQAARDLDRRTDAILAKRRWVLHRRQAADAFGAFVRVLNGGAHARIGQ